MTTTNLYIDFDFSHYTGPPVLGVAESKIVELNSEQTKCKKIVVSVEADNLEPGRQYSISYLLINSSDEIFNPGTETFYASKTKQKFSTLAIINDAEIYIMKVLITKVGTQISATDIVTVKCGTIENCPTNPSPTVLSEYVKFNNKPIQNVQEPYRCDAQVNIVANIYNAVQGKSYSYTFSSLETNPKNVITFIPSSGTVVAGDVVQNISCVGKFIGKSDIYCIKLVVRNQDEDEFEDYLLVQCSSCQ
jgi:hypothetical protein